MEDIVVPPNRTNRVEVLKKEANDHENRITILENHEPPIDLTE